MMMSTKTGRPQRESCRPDLIVRVQSCGRRGDRQAGLISRVPGALRQPAKPGTRTGLGTARKAETSPGLALAGEFTVADLVELVDGTTHVAVGVVHALRCRSGGFRPKPEGQINRSLSR